MKDNPLSIKKINWNKKSELLKKILQNNEDLGNIKFLAEKIRALIDKIDPYIQENTATVCPSCEKVCCINKHAYYEFEDLIYIYALGQREPSYKKGIKDTDPCQFLTQKGCSIQRHSRPFRCNWYFCGALLKNMEEGNARSYRKIVNLMEEILKTRRDMIEEFFNMSNIRK